MRTKFIYIENGKLLLTKEEFERYLEEAYQEGVRDGKVYSTAYSTYAEATKLNTTGASWLYDNAVTVSANDLAYCGAVNTVDKVTSCVAESAIATLEASTN